MKTADYRGGQTVRGGRITRREASIDSVREPFGNSTYGECGGRNTFQPELGSNQPEWLGP
jgi:hypothetical protein